MNIFDFYTSQLASWGFMREGDKLVFGDDRTPAYFTYNKVKRRLVLPTTAMLKAGMEDDDGTECHAYHPLCESVLYGESGTNRFMKKAIINQMWNLSMQLIEAVLEVAAEEKSVRLASYKKWLADICDGIKDPKLDKVLQQSFATLMNYVRENIDEKKRLQLFIATELVVDGTKYQRAANFRHCFEEEGEDGTATYFGATLRRKQDKVILHRLLTTVFGWYPPVTGSNDDRPYFGCLSRGWANFVINYNQIVKGLKDHTPLRPLDDAWIAEMDSLEKYNNKVQTLPYNVGPRSEHEQDNSAREYRLQPSHGHIEKAAPTTSSAEAPAEDDPMAFFSRHGIAKRGTNSILAAQDPAKLTPVQRESVERTGNANATGETINSMSLAAAVGNNTLLGNNNSGNLLGGGNNGGSLLGGSNLLGGGSTNILGGGSSSGASILGNSSTNAWGLNI
ncbi:hypothetical protein pEaSNUABM11_00045 [Erwinia phage pEa_SNUABM_11]|nr:hypothetical protein pEaSNUABM11_00045 [Erwinia phage pEa_SNUABM_11]